MWLGIKRYFAWFVGIAFNLPILVISIYLVWGWVTIGDIRAKCERIGIDPDVVLASLSKECNDIISEDGSNITNNYNRAVGSDFSRYSFKFNMEKDEIQLDGQLIGLFTALSENFVNFLFSFGLGFLMSCTILMVRVLGSKALTPRYVILRPITGAMVSGCLFLIILGSGEVFWKKASSFNGPFIGLISAFSAVYCERFENWLKDRFSKSIAGEP